MNSATVGMTVFSLDDRTVGVVKAVNICCFRFAVKDESCEVTVRWDGVFNIQDRSLSLIYIFKEPHRYQCAAHPVGPAPAIPTHSVGWAVGAGPRSAARSRWTPVEVERGLVPAA
jgi:hypothetical protein